MTARNPRSALKRTRWIVVKVGTSTLTRDGELRAAKVTDLVRQISTLADRGRKVVVVSSGAIAVGSHQLGWSHQGRSIRQKQAAAAVGQIGLLDLYRRRFARRDRQIAQVLLTRVGLEDRERFLNARHTLLELLRLGVTPIVNENDTVATDEIRFGDNDNLSATIVNLIGAELLILLTDVDGFYEGKPKSGPARPRLVSQLDRITPAVRRAALGPSSTYGRGGMATKLEAAQTAARSGASTVICNGATRDVLIRVADGEDLGTLVLPRERLSSRKHWLAFTARSRGQLVLDAGAISAVVERGRSLLPAGVVAVRGEFQVGDSVSCVDPRGRERARGLIAYTSKDIARIQGLSTREASRVLGYWNGDAVIHRDDLVVLEK
ncbi:MAG: glutamate 5-kinase [Myxococcota bacterium]